MKFKPCYLLLFLAVSANAATYYRDQYVTVPNATPCMIEIKSVQVNANFILAVYKSDELQNCNYVNPGFLKPYKYECTKRSGVVVELFNKTHYEYTPQEGNLDHILTGVLTRIESCRGR